MASSSSSSVQQKHQVFISFRGEDTRNNITSQLYAALKQKGINTFIDNQLERGEEISPALLTAIEQSTISIVVLSENYASSSWCLDELSKILECKKNNGQFVVPIFYHVDPSVVRNLRGSFAEAFGKHQEYFKYKTDKVGRWKVANLAKYLRGSFSEAFIDKVERWKAALVEVANLSGWHYQKDRPEAEFIWDVVRDIWMKLNRELSSDVEGLVGMELRIKELEELLNNMVSDGVRILGIWGVPGVGKTTTADALFKHISSQFDASYFLADAREKLERQGLECVRNELFSEIFEEDIKICTPSIIGTSIPRKLRRRKVLIVLDDVNRSNNMEYLIGDRSCYCPGSTIIITSRDRQVLEVKADEIYKVRELPFYLAYELFKQFACRGNQIRFVDDYIYLSCKVVECAGGIPLALKILGSFLCGMDIKMWESAVERLVQAKPLDKEIYNKLRISYDGLLAEEKKIFLDIACLFKGEDKNHVINILDGCGFSTEIGISVLVDKSLITISKNKLQMHDLIQEMGWEIIREESEHPYGRSRLWMYKDIIDVLTTNKVTKLTVEGIFLNMSEIKEMCIMDPQAFESMSELRLLKIYNPHSQEDYKLRFPDGLQILSKKLAYLHWHCYPLESLPLNFDPENLVELHMHYSRIIQPWKGVQKLEKLKWIDLSYSQCLKEMPDLSEAPNLERINVEGCKSLLKFPSTTRSLSKLKAVYLSGCSNLKKFPILSREVDELYLDGTAIEELPSEIQYFSRLAKLNMKNCKRLKNLRWLPKLPSDLTKLDAHGCTSLEEVSNIELPQSYSGNGDHFVFTNCFNLSQNARRNIVASALKWIQNLASLVVSQLAIWSRDPDLRCYVAASNATAMTLVGIRPCTIFCFPGVSIPEWFNHQNDGSSVTVQLPLDMVPFALCAVIEFQDYRDDWDFKVRFEVRPKIYNVERSHQTDHFKGWSGEKGKHRSVTSDHVFMWYDSSLTLGKGVADDLFGPREVSIRLYPVDKDDNLVHCCKVKKCGVRIFSDIVGVAAVNV